MISLRDNLPLLTRVTLRLRKVLNDATRRFQENHDPIEGLKFWRRERGQHQEECVSIGKHRKQLKHIKHDRSIDPKVSDSEGGNSNNRTQLFLAIFLKIILRNIFYS